MGGLSSAYFRLLLSIHNDTANVEKVTTATPLNSETGVWLCSRYTVFCASSGRPIEPEDRTLPIRIPTPIRKPKRSHLSNSRFRNYVCTPVFARTAPTRR